MSTRRVRNLRGLRVSDPSDLAESLHNAAGAKIKRVTHLGTNTVIITIDWQGGDVQFLAEIREVLDATIPVSPDGGKPSSVPSIPFRPWESWTEDQIHEAGLRPYWSRDWLQRETNRLGSITAVSREYGYTENLVRSFAKRYGIESPNARTNKHGIQDRLREAVARGITRRQDLAAECGASTTIIIYWLKRTPELAHLINPNACMPRVRRKPEEREKARSLYRAEKLSDKEIARRLGCARGSVHRWLADLKQKEGHTL